MPRAHQDGIIESALIERCLEGDDAAWETLVRRYSNLVYAIASRGGISEDDIADAVQSVFVIVWRNLELLSDPAAFAGWLTTIARRETWRLGRARARRAEREDRMASDPTAQVLPSPPARADEVLEAAERAALVQHAVETLDPRCREMLTLLFWGHPAPSHEEVAERLGMPLGSLGPTRGRCLVKLRARLADVGFR